MQFLRSISFFITTVKHEPFFLLKNLANTALTLGVSKTSRAGALLDQTTTVAVGRLLDFIGCVQ